MNPLSIYQIVHTLDGRIFHLEEHLEILFEAYYRVFRGGVKIDRMAVEKRIKGVIERSHCPKGISLFVRLSLSHGAEICIEEYERSIYSGYTLRCIAPRAVVVEYTMPNIDYPTSAREQLTQYANSQAAHSNCAVALRLHHGAIDLCCSAQLFAVVDKRIITAPKSLSVEHRLAKEAAYALNLEVEEREILHSEIALLDELFFVDHYGVTAIRECASRHYMAIVANAIASQLTAE